METPAKNYVLNVGSVEQMSPAQGVAYIRDVHSRYWRVEAAIRRAEKELANPRLRWILKDLWRWIRRPDRRW